MEIDKEKLAEQAGQLKDQAAEMMAKVDVKKATGMADAFMDKVFFFGKLFSALAMIGCAIVQAGSFLYYLICGGGSLEVPTFDTAAATALAANGDVPNLAPLKEKNAVQKKYQSKINTLLKVGNCTHSSDFNTTVELMCKIDPDLRSDFINGGIKYIEKSRKWHQDNSKEFNGTQCFVKYSEEFLDAADKMKAEGLAAKERKSKALAVFGSACLGIVLFLMIPLLIKIEENTRK